MTEFRPIDSKFATCNKKSHHYKCIDIYCARQHFQHGTDDITIVENTFALHAWQSPLFKPWQFVTYLFLHGSIEHISFQHVCLMDVWFCT